MFNAPWDAPIMHLYSCLPRGRTEPVNIPVQFDHEDVNVHSATCFKTSGRLKSIPKCFWDLIPNSNFPLFMRSFGIYYYLKEDNRT